MKTNMTREDIGNICDVQWFLYGMIYAMKITGDDCPFDDKHLASMEKGVGILKEHSKED